MYIDIHASIHTWYFTSLLAIHSQTSARYQSGMFAAPMLDDARASVQQAFQTMSMHNYWQLGVHLRETDVKTPKLTHQQSTTLGQKWCKGCRVCPLSLDMTIQHSEAHGFLFQLKEFRIKSVLVNLCFLRFDITWSKPLGWTTCPLWLPPGRSNWLPGLSTNRSEWDGTDLGMCLENLSPWL